ncbi:MAG TPA: ATP-dependent zinc metalloprotease FtsH [Longimicrobium sp.]|jgi:cell division protease FtsH|uniref:ATP-dependent zinc metalloprotease FtsH n=1 Tax=Longimicrobium sp. TaxID=2029185 RepID=UPI002ED8A09B
MADEEKGTPKPQPPRLGKVSRTAGFWLLLVMVSILAVQVTSSRTQPVRDLDYSEFLAQLASGNVQEVTVIDGKLLEGRVKTPWRNEQRKLTVNSFRTRAPVSDSEDLIKRLEAAGVRIKAREPQVGVAEVLVRALPWLLIIGLWIFFFRQMQANGNKAFQFGKSKARMLTGDTPKVTFDDVAGAEEAKAELQEIVEFLKDPKKFGRLGGRIPKGALLVGPPGTGKTLLARAVAGEAGRPFFSMSGSDFVEMFVGVGASRVRDLFEQGKSHAPCIIFIDEIDAVGRHRGAGLGGGHDEREQTLNQLLVEMDGFEGNDGVILIAATNRPDVLDPALLRPGRFDRQIVVDAPDLRGREGILKVHMLKVPLGDDVKVGVLARGTPGMCGADLANLVNEAALLAARRGREKVQMADFEDAKDKVMLGAERRSYVMKEDERRLTAYHEAGHAVCAMTVPGNDPLHKVTIVPRGRALGLAFTLPEDDRVSITRQQLEAKLVMTYGGRAAEELVFGRDRVTTGASSDIQQATSLARRYVTQWGLSDAIGPVAIAEGEHEVFLGRDIGHRREVSEKTAELVDAEVARVLNEALGRARQTLHEQVDLLHAVANNLLERETLTREEVDLLLAGKPLPPIRSIDIPGPPEVAELPAPTPERAKPPTPELKPRLA